MTISTVVTWNPMLTTEQADSVILKSEEMKLAGKTNGNWVASAQPYPPETVTRTWTTMADAEEWVAFVEQYTPISATIEQT